MTDRGHAAVEWALGVGLLLLPAALAVLSFGPWLERRVFAEGMAAETARAAVLTLDVAEGNRVGLEMAVGRNLDPALVRVGWCGAEPRALASPSGECSFARGSSVTVTVQVWVPAVTTPWGGVGGLWVVGAHAEPIDLYRSLG